MNYDEDKLLTAFASSQAAARGTRLHEFAKQAIELGIRLPRSTNTLNLFVNDAIGYRMQPEQVLFYSVNAFGTADAISFRKNLLRIHDLKTGVSPTKMTQLEIYAALFCLEYKYAPGEIDMELRIYQENEVKVHEPTTDRVAHIMDRIITFDKLIQDRRAEEGL